MKVAVPRERIPGEHRVALVPDTVAKFVKAGLTVSVEQSAGAAAGYADAAYVAAGASIAGDAAATIGDADIVVRVGRPTDVELDGMKRGAMIVGFLAPLGDPRSVERYAQRGLTALSMDAIPRTTKAQAMDALSSQANIGGYKAALIAAMALPKFFPMLTTAAGTIKPAKALIIGAGVAGLQAIATCRRLGAIVTAYDTRPVVKEQVQSLGAKFLEIDVGESGEGSGGYARELSPEAIEKQRLGMIKAIGASRRRDHDRRRTRPQSADPDHERSRCRDGRRQRDRGSRRGDRRQLRTHRARRDDDVSENGVTIVGTTNLPSTVAADASQLYSKNVQTLLDYFIKDAAITLDMTDEIIAGTTLVHDGTIVHKPTLDALAKGSA